MFVVHRSLLKHWKIQMFENLNRLSKSANRRCFDLPAFRLPCFQGLDVSDDVLLPA